MAAASESQRVWSLSCIHLLLLLLFFLPSILVDGHLHKGRIYPGYRGSQMSTIDDSGVFLVSESGEFAFKFNPAGTSFHLVIIHQSTSTVVWSANPDAPISQSDLFIFEKNGTAFLQKGEEVIWSTGANQRAAVSAMELRDSGNLVLLGSQNQTVWESFRHPTDTLLSNQDFLQGMRLAVRGQPTSSSSSSNLSYVLEIDSGDLVLSVSYGSAGSRQPYWSMSKDGREAINYAGSDTISSASISGNSWRFYDQNRAFVSQFIFVTGASDSNQTWVAVLGGDGKITFSTLNSSRSPPTVTIPHDTCQTPEPCGPYMVCYNSYSCKCPTALASIGCEPGPFPACDAESVPAQGSVDLVSPGEGVGYFALDFVPPTMKSSDLNSCMSSCLGNCSCRALFFETSSRDCFLVDRIGSLQSSDGNSSGFVSYIKVPSTGKQTENQESGSQTYVIIIVTVIVGSTILIISGLLVYARRRYFQLRENSVKPTSEEDGSEEEDNEFLECLTGAPTRFTYKELEAATNNFSMKLGQGGFGSVYHGTLTDGTQLAVKKLESVRQGRKEFRSEVTIIGSIHHLHLVRLKGFCAEGTHRLLAYEYMPKGSLDKWIFKKKENGKEEEDEQVLNWDTRYQIAVGTAKGLAYLHEDCTSKIVHCDIKPENVLLDDNFLAKVSDFGLAKLMDREQSNVFTTLRGTRGYLAPEWIMSHAISEKSDVYSFGVVLLELMGGRKNFDPDQTPEKSHLPSFAFKMMEEGKPRDVIDASLRFDEGDERVPRAIKVALWCLHDDMNLRPSMGKVVQMLEGVSPVAQPPVSSSPRGYPLIAKLANPAINENTSSETTSDYNADSYLSNVQLSGPR
ncbi:hypothetical protein SAY87_009637 [Trapa incisa]|uniref:Receptor-like serine/threonine-protein kinase n=1 Tax=Trapa incisa TaxID=236973 RepID=A0AAN7JVD4_9MYRT|nr:hypothetical protein SAY87_009637 [Trapa incisa]